MKNVKLITLLGTFVALLSLFITSCDVDHDLPAPNFKNSAKSELGLTGGMADSIEFYVNGEPVANSYVLLGDSVMFLLYAVSPEGREGLHGFSSAFTLGKFDSLWLYNPILEFEKSIRDYAERSGAIREYEATGRVSETFKAYEKSLYEKVFGKSANPPAAALHMDDSVGWLLYSADLGKQDNSIHGYSAEEDQVVVLYDDAFYRNRLLVLKGEKGVSRRFSYPLDFADRRTSSILVY